MSRVKARAIESDGGNATAPRREPSLPSQPAAPLVDWLRRRQWARRALSVLAIVIAIAAVGMLGYPVYTNLYQSRVQDRLDRELASPETAEAFTAGRVAEGDSLTRIVIPAIDVSVVVVEGTSASALRAGAGHYPQTPLPCEPGNVAIAGHRTTYGRPFGNLDRLGPGDEVVLETPIGRCEYRVNRRPFVIQPTDFRVLDATSTPTLTLTTCHPKGSARQRLIVTADLVDSPTARD